MKESNIPKIVVGIVLIVFGGLWLIANFIPGVRLNWAIAWPIFLLIPGVLLLSLWLISKNKLRDYGLLIPSTILIGLSMLFLFNMFMTVVVGFGIVWAWTLFAYPGIVALAFWLAWANSNRESGLLAVSKILGIISLALFFIFSCIVFFTTILPKSMGIQFWPVSLIFAGCVVLLWAIFRPTLWDNGEFFGKTEAEWKEWGEKFGKDMEKMGEDIGKSVEDAFASKPKANSVPQKSDDSEKVI